MAAAKAEFAELFAAAEVSVKHQSTKHQYVLKHDPGLRLNKVAIDTLEMYIKDCFMFDIVRLGITQRLLQ